MQRIAIIENNVVVNVIMLEDGHKLPAIDSGLQYVVNDWACVGDWYEEQEQRFYRVLPNNADMHGETHE